MAYQSKKLEKLESCQYSQAFYFDIVKRGIAQNRLNVVRNVTITNIGNGKFNIVFQDSRNGVYRKLLNVRWNLVRFEMNRLSRDMRKWNITGIA